MELNASSLFHVSNCPRYGRQVSNRSLTMQAFSALLR